jgi:phage host-nuclease inhibitor protein Gam
MNNKRQKLEPCIISSRQGLDSVVADVVRLKLEHKEATAAMEKEIAEVQKQHQENLLSLAGQIEARESGAFHYCSANRAALFPEKKSLDLLLAEIGFELTPPRVEKVRSKDTLGAIATRLLALVWGSKYVRQPAPEVNKEQILQDRAELGDKLAQAGLKIEQDENFFIRPKSQVAEQTVKVAA